MRSMLDELVNRSLVIKITILHTIFDEFFHRLFKLKVQNCDADGKRERRPLGKAIRPGLALL